MLFVLSLLAVGLVGQETIGDPGPARATVVRETLELGLVDYPSARLREVHTVRRTDNAFVKVAACGMVNSRTPSGGYAGWVRFVVLDDDLYTDRESIGRRAIAGWCDGPTVQTLEADVTALVAPTATSEHATPPQS